VCQPVSSTPSQRAEQRQRFQLLISEKIRDSKVLIFAKAVSLMRGRTEGDLAGFLAIDPKGRQLPGTCSNLAAHLAQGQEEILQEAGSLAKKSWHIKEIVAMQQEYAKSPGISGIAVDAWTCSKTPSAMNIRLDGTPPHQGGSRVCRSRAEFWRRNTRSCNPRQRHPQCQVRLTIIPGRRTNKSPLRVAMADNSVQNIGG